MNLLKGVANKDKNKFHVMLEGFCRRGAIELYVLFNTKQWGYGNIGMAMKSLGENPYVKIGDPIPSCYRRGNSGG